MTGTEGDFTGPSLLFCPASRPERFGKAVNAADSVILDLEDGVAPADKEVARLCVVDALTRLDPARTIVRINPPGTPWFRRDVEALRATDVRTILLPKAADPSVLEDLGPWRVIALCETAAGVLNAPALARSATCAGLFWGAEDLTADLGGRRSRGNDGRYLGFAEHARSTVRLAAAAAGVPAIDAVYLFLEDDDGLAAEAAQAADWGFSAKAALHPRQVPIIRSAFAPPPELLEWAEAVLEASTTKTGAFRFRGQMVDEPLVAHARSVVSAVRPEGAP
jgi:citrate lyase subunit beta / citryl-CoA lyase